MVLKSLVHLIPQHLIWLGIYKDRNKLDRIWRNIIDEDVDIIVTHGPPKGILDLSFDRRGGIERCGDKSLLNRVKE